MRRHTHVVAFGFCQDAEERRIAVRYPMAEGKTADEDGDTSEDGIGQKSKFQTLVFTWLGDAEISKFRKLGTVVLTPAGDHFLQPVKTAPAVVAPIAPPVPPANTGPKDS